MFDRRSFLLGAGALLAGAPGARAAEPGVGDGEILLGQSCVLSGPLGGGGTSLQGGISLALEQANARGGIGGRRLRLLALDDAFDPARAQANYQALARQALACIGGAGAGQTLAALPVLQEHGMALVGASAVIDSAREKTRGLAYYTRASQEREAEVLVQHLHTLGITKIAFVHLATPGGREVLGQVQAALASRGLKMSGAVAVATDGRDVEAAGKALAALQPQAALLFLTGAPAAALMKAVWENHASPAFYGMSILPGEVTARLLGTQTRGLAISQVTPYPWDGANADAVEFRRGAEKAGMHVDYHGYEGYLSARVLIEALKPLGRDVTRAKLLASLQRLKTRIAGVDYDFSGGRHTGSTFVELVQVRYDGKFVR